MELNRKLSYLRLKQLLIDLGIPVYEKDKTKLQLWNRLKKWHPYTVDKAIFHLNLNQYYQDASGNFLDYYPDEIIDYLRELLLNRKSIKNPYIYLPMKIKPERIQLDKKFMKTGETIYAPIPKIKEDKVIYAPMPEFKEDEIIYSKLNFE